MVHMPNSYTYDFWLRGSAEQNVELSCLMPNSIFISIQANRNATLHEIKEELFEEAAKFPMGWRLQDSSQYNFSFINSMAEQEEVVDESRRLCDVKPFMAVLKVVEKKGDSREKLLNAQISHIIGKGQYEFEALKNPEVNYFRWQMKQLIEDEKSRCDVEDWRKRLKSQFPPRIDPSDNFPSSIANKLKDGNFFLFVKFEALETSFKFYVSHKMSPNQLMVNVLIKKAVGFRSQGECPEDFVFKVKGQEEYLEGNHPLIKYLYIQESLSMDILPTLIVVHVNSVPVDVISGFEANEYHEDKYVRTSFSTSTLRKRGKFVSSWNIEEAFAFKVQAICRLNCDSARTVEVCVEAGLFHGGKALCESRKTSERVVSKEGEVTWDEDLQFDIKVANIPRMARLCFVVYEISKSAKGTRSRKLKTSKQEMFINPMGWVNSTVYDFKNQLRTGSMTLYMWTYEEDVQSDDLLHSLGTVVSNTSTEQAAALTVTFYKYHVEHMVVYPTVDKIRENSKENDIGVPRYPSSRFSADQIRSLIVHEMHEQERKGLWALRYELLWHEPTLLPKLLDCVEWNDRNEVCEATALLYKWPLLPPEVALELLDYAYADQAVRCFAVKCLFEVSNEDLLLFLLQLVQALKHECYLHCDLVEFLLKKALRNRKIGHYLFWHLRSEMHVASVWIRYGLMLEAYCRGATEHMKALGRQLEMLNKFKSFSESIRLKRDKDKARASLRESLREQHVVDSIKNVLNPLDPTYRFSCVQVDKCKVMDSKMRPLWLVLGNSDPFGDDVYLIFKNGDDLRQDMLALQMIRIMDKLWKNEGNDFRMNPYKCISTDNRVGLIEVVLNAETIANIQKKKGGFSATASFRRGSILEWLKDHNQTEASLNKAIEEFTFSCAGYCVATYVLGVADRHSDNIMVKKTGQLFHIDFGHILGHFKEKFGFRRERVPFVLTNDFVHVINKGRQAKGGAKKLREFDIFQKKCEQAFLTLRRHGGLILSLFAMMISTGLPELSSENDLNYLKETLVLDLSEEDALSHFRSKFDEALSNSWKTSLNWASHNMSKNNKD